MRTPLIAGNWKMQGNAAQATSLVKNILASINRLPNVELLVCPPFVHLPLVKQLLSNTPLHLGAQNLSAEASGAFTGEIAGPMLKDIGCEFVLVGHSERRTLFGEDLPLVAAKFKAAQDAGLTPILCIGETKEERESAETENVLMQQLTSVMKLVGINAFKNAVIAYEPVWAIGTGLTATPDQAQSAHLFIRQLISQNNIDIGKSIRILYGGSMKPDNAAALLSMPDIDGGLIGGASLVAESFLAIGSAAERELAA